MDVTCFRMVDFHIPDEDERKMIRSLQRKRRRQCFIKRMAILFIIIAICVIFQLMARKTAPTRFSVNSTVEKLIAKAVLIFVGANILSWIELIIEQKVLFRAKKAEVAFVRIKKKLVVENIWYSYKFFKKRILICEQIIGHEKHQDDNVNFEQDIVESTEKTALILDNILIHGLLTFSNVREGDMVYIERIYDDGNYIYHYVA